MKIKTLLAMGLCAAIGLTTSTVSLRADDKEHKEHKEGEKHEEKEGKMKIPDTVEGIWTEIHHHHTELAETVKNKKLADVHHHAFAIRDLAKALPDKVEADKKTKVEGAVKNISKLADQLDKAGDDGNQADTEAHLKKLDGVLKMLEAQCEKK
ncbi:MAG: hypothetical protein ABI042_18480 [Verrucomicrobiota bacterium]